MIGLCSGMTYGPVAALLVELFPARIRYTSMSIPYHIGTGYFGGFLPFISQYIVARTGDPFAGLWYTIAVVAMALVVTFFWLPETAGKELEYGFPRAARPLSADSMPELRPPLRLNLDGDALVANWRWLEKRGGGAACGAAVKADGYGLGARDVVMRLANAGCRDFFVATWAEAEDLSPWLGGASVSRPPRRRRRGSRPRRRRRRRGRCSTRRSRSRAGRRRGGGGPATS